LLRGYTAINIKRNLFALDNSTTGFDLHQLDNDPSITIWTCRNSGGRMKVGSESTKFKPSGVVFYTLKFAVHVMVFVAAFAFLFQSVPNLQGLCERHFSLTGFRQMQLQRGWR
jgi:hypothetical protein